MVSALVRLSAPLRAGLCWWVWLCEGCGCRSCFILRSRLVRDSTSVDLSRLPDIRGEAQGRGEPAAPFTASERGGGGQSSEEAEGEVEEAAEADSGAAPPPSPPSLLRWRAARMPGRSSEAGRAEEADDADHIPAQARDAEQSKGEQRHTKEGLSLEGQRPERETEREGGGRGAERRRLRRREEGNDGL